MSPTTSATGPRHTDPEDLVLFAMQFLADDEAAAITRHLEHCAECRHELARIHGDLATTAFTADLHSPPASARQRLLKQVAREKKIVPISQPALAAYGRTASELTELEEEERPRSSVALTILGWTGWAVAAGLAFATATLYRDRDGLSGTVASQTGQIQRLIVADAPANQLMDTLNDPQAMRVTLTLTAKPQPKPQPIAHATYSSANGGLVFVASNLERLQMYKVYELWLIPSDGHDPIPADTFHPDDHGNARVILQRPELKGVAVKAFGVTVEDDGGSQTPTPPIFMAGS